MSISSASFAETKSEPVGRQRVFTRHNGIPGRARLQVIGLRSNPELKRLLETAVLGNGIRTIEASSVTGNLLVFFDPAKDLAEVVGYLEIVIRQPTPAQPAAPADHLYRAEGGDR